MAQSEVPPRELSPPTPDSRLPHRLWRKLLGRSNGANESAAEPPAAQEPGAGDESRPEPIRRKQREVVPGLPRAKTFKRQQSELREKLEPVQTTPDERRALSMDRRWHSSQRSSQQSLPQSSAPDIVDPSLSEVSSIPSHPASPIGRRTFGSISELPLAKDETQFPIEEERPLPPVSLPSLADDASMTTSQYDDAIRDELERKWILNLSMHFRDRTKREKFFVTYRQSKSRWRRVTISLDYRDAPEDSLEMDLFRTKHQRDKNAKIYEAIRESLDDIQFYDTVTNLKLQTTDGRLHVHVVEDVNEVIDHPGVSTVKHLGCPRIKESDIDFDSHMSGFVYKVRVDGRLLIKKEIPGPDTVDEFLYEVNALHHLRHSDHVIEFYGVVVDDADEKVKGLLISYAERGALIDVIFDNEHRLPWETREGWARQVISGLSDIHEAGFVQGDFTLSNIVIDGDDDARIIDINRRGCPVGWEPPEATPLIDTGQRISMYIGVKSDLYQLGMVLWALATQEDEPESQGRPLVFDDEIKDTIPMWFQHIVRTCLDPDPRRRIQATNLLQMFPDHGVRNVRRSRHSPPPTSGGISPGHRAAPTAGEVHPEHLSAPVKWTQPPNPWRFDSGGAGGQYYPPSSLEDQSYFYPARGRSPPSPLPSNHDGDSVRHKPFWSRGYSYSGELSATSVSSAHDEAGLAAQQRGGAMSEKGSTPPRLSAESLPRIRVGDGGGDDDEDDTVESKGGRREGGAGLGLGLGLEEHEETPRAEDDEGKEILPAIVDSESRDAAETLGSSAASTAPAHKDNATPVPQHAQEQNREDAAGLPELRATEDLTPIPIRNLTPVTTRSGQETITSIDEQHGYSNDHNNYKDIVSSTIAETGSTAPAPPSSRGDADGGGGSSNRANRQNSNNNNNDEEENDPPGTGEGAPLSSSVVATTAAAAAKEEEEEEEEKQRVAKAAYGLTSELQRRISASSTDGGADLLGGAGMAEDSRAKASPVWRNVAEDLQGIGSAHGELPGGGEAPKGGDGAGQGQGGMETDLGLLTTATTTTTTTDDGK